MEALIITAILGIAILWHFYNKNAMQQEANDEYVKRLMKVSTKEGYDIWDDRLEGHVEDDEKRRRKANTKMLEDAENNRYLESVKSSCKVDDIDVWDVRLEGLVGIEEKNRRQSNAKMLEDAKNNSFVRKAIPEFKVGDVEVWDNRLEGSVSIEEKKRRKANSKMLKDAESHTWLNELRATTKVKGMDIWDSRLEGLISVEEKQRRQANSRMLEEANNNHLLEKLKSECKSGDIDIWDHRLEGLLDIEEKKTRQQNTKILEAAEIRDRLESLETEAVFMDKEYESYHQAAIALDVKISDYEALRHCEIDEDGVKLNNRFLREVTGILLLEESSFCQNHELTIKVIKFFKGYPEQLKDFVNAIDLALTNKKITKFGNMGNYLLSGGGSSPKENLIVYFFDQVVVDMGEFRESYYKIDCKNNYSALYLPRNYDDALAYFVSQCIVIGIGEKCALKYFRKKIKRFVSSRKNSKEIDGTLWDIINDEYLDIELKTIRQIIIYIAKSNDPCLRFSRYNDDSKVMVRNFQDDLFLNFSLEGGERYLSRVVRKARKKIEEEILDLDIEVEPEAESEPLDNAKLFTGTGLEYEAYMHARIERETPFDVELTKSSGDHGADLVIRKLGYSAVVQLKLYSTPVGNKAVQEAYTAKQHYHVGHAFVVTNSSYTRAAYEVAETTGVMLFQDEEFIKYLKSDFFY
ncbi:restriction endonuclease [Cobetia sp. 10Alg 146]|uniref:restriction endonuclease n=1 Tax=Cobetia sp. 10Alg 146 TaxID=3040019 RepID=UPI00244975D1|nr:restriction endonuclease [Cobetia sp. 10Alg 146]MDH2290003.1 restriction endonuclease [Cobetia sp. 10Alg 146]